MSDKPMIYCEDCKHYSDVGQFEPVCTNRSIPSPVSRKLSTYDTCRTARVFPELCGPDATNFEPRNPS